MKKVLLFLFAVIAVLQVSAQEKETTRDTTATITIEDLSVKLNKLQRDYDYLQCDYELHKIITEFNEMSSSINITTNGLITYCYHAVYDHALYNAYVDNYNAKYETFQALKEKYDVVKRTVLLRTLASDFSKEELNVIEASFEVLQNSIKTVELALRHYDSAIENFRNKR